MARQGAVTMETLVSPEKSVVARDRVEFSEKLVERYLYRTLTLRRASDPLSNLGCLIFTVPMRWAPFRLEFRI